jgi:exosome complex component RRP4
MATTTTHLVVPGQVIVEGGDDFLRGHGTYVESVANNEIRLVASVAGHVERVNKLVSVIPVASHLYQGHVGDLVVGRIVAIQSTRWKVSIAGDTASSRAAVLPLSGVHLPGGVQRVRTTQDSREMRQLFQEGDLVSAEVHTVLQQDGTYMLHTRSLRYGKLENGCLVIVPPSLIARRKNHFCDVLQDTMTLLLGTNGYIWIQRALPPQLEDNGGVQLAEHQEKVKRHHANTPVLPDERQRIARLRNAITALAMVHLLVTPEHIEVVYQKAIVQRMGIADMLHPDNVILLTRELLTKK